jgi:hypothetical protein
MWPAGLSGYQKHETTARATSALNTGAKIRRSPVATETPTTAMAILDIIIFVIPSETSGANAGSASENFVDGDTGFEAAGLCREAPCFKLGPAIRTV